ncbi:MAG: hypothetical protein IJ997_01320 [Mycoplasmataceae bacterium]|nr:hypothetical protein [Mycoplasmataceae bacterium]
MNKPTIYNRKNFYLTNTIANSIRRALINEVRTYTFDNVTFNNFNSSIYNTEYIIQRLRLIPLNQSSVKNYKDLKFRCNVTNNSDKYLQVTPKDIKTLEGKILYKLIDKNILEDLPIIYLPPNESIDFTCNLVANSETGYNKYCHCWYDENDFYIESINKSNGGEIKTAINYLINQCNKIRNKIINNYLNKTQSNFKIDIKLENISRSALNVIVDHTRMILTNIISYIITNGNTTQAELTPSDFIISIVQPHLSENKYSILFDINMKYLLQSTNEKKLHVVGLFMGYLQSNNIDYSNYINTNNAIFIIIGCIDSTIRYLNFMMGMF